MEEKLFFKQFIEIRSICEEGGMNDKSKLDAIHKIADDIVCFIEDPEKYPIDVKKYHL